MRIDYPNRSKRYAMTEELRLTNALSKNRCRCRRPTILLMLLYETKKAAAKMLETTTSVLLAALCDNGGNVAVVDVMIV